jgi:hypothetical protein
MAILLFDNLPWQRMVDWEAWVEWVCGGMIQRLLHMHRAHDGHRAR